VGYFNLRPSSFFESTSDMASKEIGIPPPDKGFVGPSRGDGLDVETAPEMIDVDRIEKVYT
jgi:hypothetical protein